MAVAAAKSSGGRGIGANDGGRPDIKLFCVLFSSFGSWSTADNDSGLEFGCCTAAPSSSVPLSRTLRHDRECRRAVMARNERSFAVCILTTTTILTTHARKHSIVYVYMRRYIVVDKKKCERKNNSCYHSAGRYHTTVGGGKWRPVALNPRVSHNPLAVDVASGFANSIRRVLFGVLRFLFFFCSRVNTPRFDRVKSGSSLIVDKFPFKRTTTMTYVVYWQNNFLYKP